MEFSTPLDVVQAQLDAYNARDIEAFARTFADDVIVFDLDAQSASSAAVRFEGLAALRERYGAQFTTHPRQRSTVLTRSVVGSYVFDLEHITGVAEREPYVLMAVYRVTRGSAGLRIDRAWFTPRA
jgi:hypothetical protein